MSRPEAAGAAPAPRRIGVYVCHCGGNISDYVDVAKVVESVQATAMSPWRGRPCSPALMRRSRT